MSTFTTKLGLSKPADSDTDWGQEYRDAMDTIDDNPGIIVVADSTALAALSDNWEGRLAYNAEDDKLYKYDGTDWIEVGPASVADNTLTTKGDLMVYGTALARLGVGSNGQVLTSDSSQALGMKWANLPESGGGSGTPSGDGTVEDNPETLAESSGSFTASISYIEVLSALWLAGIRFYVGSTAGSVTVNLRTAGGELLATKTITATGTAWNVFTFTNPVYLTSHGFYIVEVLLSSQKLWRKTSTLYSGTLWKMRQHRVNDFFTGSVYSETPGLGLVEYDDTP